MSVSVSVSLESAFHLCERQRNALSRIWRTTLALFGPSAVREAATEDFKLGHVFPLNLLRSAGRPRKDLKRSH